MFARAIVIQNRTTSRISGSIVTAMKPDLKHLRLNHRRWWYVRHIPAKLAPYFPEPHRGKHHFLINLETGDLGKAQRQRAKLNATYELIIDKLRRKLEDEPDRVTLQVENLIKTMMVDEATLDDNGEGYDPDVWHQTFRKIEQELGKAAREKAVAVYVGKSITLTDTYLDDWIKDENGEVTVTLQSKRRKAVIRLAKFLDGKTVEKVTRDDARAFARSLDEFAPGTIRETLKHLSLYWRYLYDRKLVPDGLIFKDLKKRKKTGVDIEKVARAFEDHEVKSLLRGTWPYTDEKRKNFMHDFIRTGLLTGARQGELMRLKVKHVDIEKGTVIIPGSNTTSSPRTIPIHDELVSIFSRRISGRKSDDLIFDDMGWKVSSSVASAFYDYRKSCGVHDQVEGDRRAKTTFHSARRWMAKKLREADVPSETIKAIQGWASNDMLTLYARGANEIASMRSALAKVSLKPLEFAV